MVDDNIQKDQDIECIDISGEKKGNNPEQTTPNIQTAGVKKIRLRGKIIAFAILSGAYILVSSKFLSRFSTLGGVVDNKAQNSMLDEVLTEAGEEDGIDYIYQCDNYYPDLIELSEKINNLNLKAKIGKEAYEKATLDGDVDVEEAKELFETYKDLTKKGVRIDVYSPQSMELYQVACHLAGMEKEINKTLAVEAWDYYADAAKLIYKSTIGDYGNEDSSIIHDIRLSQEEDGKRYVTIDKGDMKYKMEISPKEEESFVSAITEFGYPDNFANNIFEAQTRSAENKSKGSFSYDSKNNKDLKRAFNNLRDYASMKVRVLNFFDKKCVRVIFTRYQRIGERCKSIGRWYDSISRGGKNPSN